MARIFTTPEAERSAKIIMHDITVAGGINTKNLRTHTPYSFGRTDYCTAASQICDEFINREFTNVDAALNRVSDFYFKPNYDGSGKNKSIKPEGVAKCVVYMAEQLNIYWDDTVRTPYEIEEFKKTMLGSAVYKYNRYISAIKDKSSKSKAVAGPSVAAATGGTGVAGQSNAAAQPKNGYKQSGPQSGNVRDLRDLSGGPGKPGQKVHGSHSQGLMFKIMGDNTMSKNKANVYVKPLSKSGAVGTTNKIFIASGNGYTDCTCYFDDLSDAQAMLNKIVADNRVPSNVQNLQVVKLKADPNGYFLVGTEYGICAISAKTLNEALAEAMNEEVERPTDWEKATEGYSKKELDELHTWMRRG
jgi:hypothetical protein